MVHEELDRPLPGKFRRLAVVSRRCVIVEAVVDVRIIVVDKSRPPLFLDRCDIPASSAASADDVLLELLYFFLLIGNDRLHEIAN